MKILMVSNEPELRDLDTANSRHRVVGMEQKNWEAEESPELAQQILMSKSRMVVFGPDVPGQIVLDVSRSIKGTNPELICLAYTEQSSQFLAQAMRAGLRDVVSPDEGLEELVGSITSLETAREVLESNIIGAQDAADANKVITFMGPKGGVGKSTLAVNMAYRLAQTNPNQVVLLDLDLEGCGVADLLQVETASTIASVTSEGAAVDGTSIKLSLSAHASGLLVLPGPSSLLEVEKVGLEKLGRVIEELSDLFKYVILDTGPGSTSATVVAMMAATEVVSVVSPEIGSAKTLMKHNEALDELGINYFKHYIVLNKDDPKSGISAQNISAILDKEVSFSIPFERMMPAAGNQGVPYLEKATKGTAAMAMQQMIDSVAGVNVEAMAGQAKSGWFK